MSKTRLKVFAFALCGLLSAVALADSGEEINDTTIINEIAGYKQWTRVNANPFVTINPGSFG
jgi:hypothetical protein